MLEFKLIRSNRNSISIEINPRGQLVVRAPLHMSLNDVRRFVSSKEDWIRVHRKKAIERAEKLKPDTSELLTEADLRALADYAKKVIPGRVAYYAPKIGVTYGRITIRNQRTRWGSCSAKGNLNFNCLLMLAPSEVLDSVVVHELCHRLYMNHSKLFYEEVLRVFPQYRRCERWLKENGPALMARMTG